MRLLMSAVTMLVFAGPAYCQAKTQTDANTQKAAVLVQQATTSDSAKLAYGEFGAWDELFVEQSQRFVDFQYDLWDLLGETGYNQLNGYLLASAVIGGDGLPNYILAEWGPELDDKCWEYLSNGHARYNLADWQGAWSWYQDAYGESLTADSLYQLAADEWAEAYSAALAAKNLMDGVLNP